MDNSSQLSTPLMQKGRMFSLLAMIVGASFLTISAFDFNLRDESKSRTIITTAFSVLIFLGGTTLLLVTRRNFGLPMWDLILAGNLCGGGALGLGILIFGPQQVLKVLASSTWGWAIGMGSYTWRKGNYKQNDAFKNAV